jgi:prepilin-type N-terminal cleavage/methylation domain-containing protein
VTYRSSGGFTLVEVLVALVVVALGLAALMVAVQGAARTSGYLRDKTLAQWIALNRIAEVRIAANKSGTTAPVSVTSTLSTSTSTSTSTSNSNSNSNSNSTSNATSTSNSTTNSNPTSTSTSNSSPSPSSSSSSNFNSTNDTGELQFAGRTWHYDTRYFNTSYPDMKRIVVRVWAGDAKTKSNPIAETTSFYGTSLGQPGLSNIDWTVGSTAAPQPCAPQNNGATPVGIGGAGNPVNGAIGNNGAPGTGCAQAPGIPGVPPTIQPTITAPPQ